MLSNADAAVEAVYASDWGRIVAILIRSFGDFDLAEEAVRRLLRPPSTNGAIPASGFPTCVDHPDGSSQGD